MPWNINRGTDRKSLLRSARRGNGLPAVAAISIDRMQTRANDNVEPD